MNKIYNKKLKQNKQKIKHHPVRQIKSEIELNINQLRIELRTQY